MPIGAFIIQVGIDSIAATEGESLMLRPSAFIIGIWQLRQTGLSLLRG